MGFTTDPNDPRLSRGVDESQVPQAEVYLILSEEERAKGFVRPLRQVYLHSACGAVTKMALPLAETYARWPKFYGSTFCVCCSKHRPVGEFTWDQDGSVVGS